MMDICLNNEKILGLLGLRHFMFPLKNISSGMNSRPSLDSLCSVMFSGKGEPGPLSYRSE